jgi:predicted RNase H-like HicB family nuclease
MKTSDNHFDPHVTAVIPTRVSASHGIFVTKCPSLPGCISQEKTREKALVNIKDAARRYLYSLKKHDEN